MITDPRTTEHYLHAIREKVCGLCRHSDEENLCGADVASQCAIERFLPQIVEVAVSVNSDRMDDYVSALRDTVCRLCRDNGELHCSMREASSCSLDRFFVIILEAIEEVILRHRAGSESPA